MVAHSRSSLSSFLDIVVPFKPCSHKRSSAAGQSVGKRLYAERALMLGFPPHSKKYSHLDECLRGTRPQVPPQPQPAVLPHLRHCEVPPKAQFGGCPQEAPRTLWRAADFVLTTGLNMSHGRERRRRRRSKTQTTLISKT